MYCQYMLTNVKHDNTYKNVPYFTNVEERNKHLITRNFDGNQVNFNFGNILTTSCVVNTYNNENYMIVKQGNNLYFYFVTDCDYISATQWRLRLELDVISQYCCGIHDNQSVAKCYIERGHIDRFYDAGNNNVAFNVNNSSLIIEKEMQFEKITKRRHEIKLRYCKDDRVNNWLQENILGWQYMYVAVNHNYKVTGTSSGYAPYAYSEEYNKAYSKRGYNIGGSLFQDEFSLCCVPIYKNEQNCIYIEDGNNLILAKIDSFEYFRKQNADNSYVYNIKYSIHPPFNFDDVSALPRDGKLYIYKQCKQDLGLGMFTFFDFGTFDVDCFGPVSKSGNMLYRPHNIFSNLNYASSRCETVTTQNNFIFNKDALRGNRSVAFEPKVLVDCKSVTLRDSSNGEYVYPSLYIGNKTVQPYYNESMSITNNNYYYRLGNAGIIPNADRYNWTGIVNTVDYSQQIANNSYAEFIANNKNFLLTKGLNMVTSGLQGNVLGVVSDMYNVWQGLDNLQNKPNSMKNTNDSVELNMLVNNGIKLYVDEDEAREVDIYRYYNYLYNNGYKINRYDYIGNYIHTRYYFNYIKAQIDYININAPDAVTTKIKRIFADGVRLWNRYDDMYNYEKENREIWI
ncbi:MAG: hypothetical protein J6S85_25065 [Methanobrevibacter sp.]|nr:hypothetical protein [Methanobrevibacter sp.]